MSERPDDQAGPPLPSGFLRPNGFAGGRLIPSEGSEYCGLSAPIFVTDPSFYWRTAACVRRRIGVWLMCLVVFEGALMGSGRLLQIGPVTVKEALFLFALLFTTWSLLSLDRITWTTALLTASFAGFLCLGSMIGLLDGALPKAVGADLSPLLSFFLLPFFELTIRNREDLRRIEQIIEWAAAIMAIGYAAVIALLLSGRVSFIVLYNWITVHGGDDFFFEGTEGRVFYKGSLYIGIALIFVLFRKGLRFRLAALLLGLSLYVVGLRGFFLALAAVAILYVLIRPRPPIRKIVALSTSLLLTTILLSWLFLQSGDKSESDTIRLQTISQVGERINFGSVIVGHGFGNGVPVRPVHMEISYLEILHKQGLLGLAWWGAFLLLLILRFHKVPLQKEGGLAYPYFLAAAFVAFESATNPFIDNPIGLYYLEIAFVALNVLSRTSDSWVTP